MLITSGTWATDCVGQLGALSKITKDRPSLARSKSKPAAAILGIAKGDGLERVEKERDGPSIGIDIGREFIDLCRERHYQLVPSFG
jgi:hypothetical protein